MQRESNSNMSVKSQNRMAHYSRRDRGPHRRGSRRPPRVCVCVCIAIPFILDVGFVDVPAGVTQDFSTFILRCLPSLFSREGFSPFLSLVDREVEFCVLNDFNPSPPVGLFFFCWGEEIPVRVVYQKNYPPTLDILATIVRSGNIYVRRGALRGDHS